MPQQLDDVTGDPIRFSARQRELQREAMVAMLNAQTVQLNTLTQRVRELSNEVIVLKAIQGETFNKLTAFLERPWFARLRWIVRGR